MLELLKFAKKYPVTDGRSRPRIIDVRQATYFSPSSTARSVSSSQGYHSSTLQARGPNRFESVASTDRPPIQSKNGPAAACSPGSNTSPQAKAGRRKRNYSRNSLARSRFENSNGPAASLPGSGIPSVKAGRSTQFLGNSSDRSSIQSKYGPAASCLPGSNTSPQAKAGRKRNYSRNSPAQSILKIQTVLPRLCRVLPSPQ
jgi:hypothetical protein